MTATSVAPGGRRRPGPAGVARPPKGCTGSKELDGKAVEGSWRSHQVPLARPRPDDERRAS